MLSINAGYLVSKKKRIGWLWVWLWLMPKRTLLPTKIGVGLSSAALIVIIIVVGGEVYHQQH